MKLEEATREILVAETASESGVKAGDVRLL